MHGYRTYIAAALVAVFSVLAMTDWISIFNDPKAGLLGLGAAILMAIMRSITTTPPALPAPKVEDPKVEPPKTDK